MIKDFPKPDLSERAAAAKVLHHPGAGHPAPVRDRRSPQGPAIPARGSSMLKTFHGERDLHRAPDRGSRDRAARRQQQAADRPWPPTCASSGEIDPSDRADLEEATGRGLEGHREGPDAVRDRFAAWRKADPATVRSDRRRSSPWRCRATWSGTTAAVSDLKAAEVLWKARDLVHEYLAGAEPPERENIAGQLEELDWPAARARPRAIRKLDLLTRMVQLMPPPSATTPPRRPRRP